VRDTVPGLSMHEPLTSLLPQSLELSLIEGYFGRPWSWSEREQVMLRLASNGYSSFLYAPKADAYLRRRWREPHPEAEQQAIAKFADQCKSAGVRFGVGLSPYELYLDFDHSAQANLTQKIAAIDSLGIVDLAILFDDMEGDHPDLAERQAEIMYFVMSRTKAERVFFCPTYYSDENSLDQDFGCRPSDYLECIGRLLDPQIRIFWTGEEVCSREYSPGHLQRVGEQLQRKPFLWDNYPVNDGPQMSKHLHLKGFTGRPAAIAKHLSGHGVNPALQPLLSCIPAVTLPMSYARGENYCYREAFQEAARAMVGEELAGMLLCDMFALMDAGLDRLGDELEPLRARYNDLSHPAAKEVVMWLDGAYSISLEAMRAQ
jgi:hyaluronoglucosaminidase